MRTNAGGGGAARREELPHLSRTASAQQPVCASPAEARGGARNPSCNVRREIAQHGRGPAWHPQDRGSLHTAGSFSSRGSLAVHAGRRLGDLISGAIGSSQEASFYWSENGVSR